MIVTDKVLLNSTGNCINGTECSKHVCLCAQVMSDSLQPHGL